MPKFQFSIRSLLAVALCVSISAASLVAWAGSLERQRQTQLEVVDYLQSEVPTAVCSYRTIKPSIFARLTFRDTAFVDRLSAIDFSGSILEPVDAKLEISFGDKQFELLKSKLKTLSTLTELNLSNTQVSDSTLLELQSFAHLESLDIRNCPNLSTDAISRLASGLPNLKINR